jgi:hypothetical protein
VNRAQQAFENLRVAYEARDVALDRAAAATYAQFTAIVTQYQNEYKEALRQSGEASDAMDD